MFVIQTDPYSGTLPFGVNWSDKGMVGYFSQGLVITFNFESVKVFESREEAEAEAFVFAITVPEVVGHLHVLPESEARLRHQEALEKFVKEIMTRDPNPEGTGFFGLAT